MKKMVQCNFPEESSCHLFSFSVSRLSDECAACLLSTASDESVLLPMAKGFDAHFFPFISLLDEEVRRECDALRHASVRSAIDFEDTISFL
jgi:hypothetical protein